MTYPSQRYITINVNVGQKSYFPRHPLSGIQPVQDQTHLRAHVSRSVSEILSAYFAHLDQWTGCVTQDPHVAIASL